MERIKGNKQKFKTNIHNDQLHPRRNASSPSFRYTTAATAQTINNSQADLIAAFILILCYCFDLQNDIR